MPHVVRPPFFVSVHPGTTTAGLHDAIVAAFPALDEIKGACLCACGVGSGRAVNHHSGWQASAHLANHRRLSLPTPTDSIVLAVNQAYVDGADARALAEGDEVAVIPPISGG